METVIWQLVLYALYALSHIPSPTFTKNIITLNQEYDSIQVFFNLQCQKIPCLVQRVNWVTLLSFIVSENVFNFNCSRDVGPFSV